MKKKRSKRFRKLIDLSKDKKITTIDEILKKIKINCTTKFNESIDVSFKLNLKQKKDEVSFRSVVNLPHGNEKKVRVAVLCEDGKIQEAKNIYCEFLCKNLENIAEEFANVIYNEMQLIPK